MPYASSKQRDFLEAIRAGWRPDHIKNPPSQAVAEKFHREDKASAKRQMVVKALRDAP